MTVTAPVASPGSRRRLGLYGGSFDPPHNAHLALARLARDHLALDELRIVPAGRPWQKQHRVLASPEHRAQMVKLAVDGEPRVVVDDIELRTPGPHYTIDTLRALQSQTPGDWFLIIGQDQYAQLHTWRDWPALLRMATIAVAARNDEQPQPGAQLAAVPHKSTVLPLPPMPLSSTELRARAARGEPLDGLVPPEVARYIDRNHLYRS
jgi:nicotinate-nucleotide adenylyltransferase